MKDVFHKLVNAGIFPHTSIELIDEIRVINSIKIQGALLVWAAGLTKIYFIPAHWMFGKTNKDYSDYRKLEGDFTDVREEMVAKAMHGDLTIRWEENMKTRDLRDTYHIMNLVPMTSFKNRNQRSF